MIGNRTRDFTHASRLLYFCATETVTTHVRMYMCTYTPVYANACARARYTHDGIVDDALQLVARLLARHDVGVAHVRAELLHLRQL